MTTTGDKEEAIRRAFARAREFTGWGSFDIEVRDLGPSRPWNYGELARDAARAAESVLDLETGGGEQLLSIAVGMLGRCVATEAWHKNVPVAASQLRPAGIDVVRCSSEEQRRFPFRDGAFDLVLNRHGAINATEIARVLCAGGQFVTQQVDPADWAELWRYFPRASDSAWNHHERRVAEFEQLGCQVAAKRHEYKVAYGGLDDLVFNLAVAPWTIPGLSLERDLPALLRLEEDLTTSDGLVMTRALYLLTATRPPR